MISSSLRYVLIATGLALTTARGDEIRSDLRESLRMHASFDTGFAADFSRGDPVLYEFTNRAERQAGGRPARPDEHLRIDSGEGRFRGSLVRANPRQGRLFYRGADIVVPRQERFSGTVSVWLRTSPDEDLAEGYCDPVMILSDDFQKGALFVEWAPGTAPRSFRYAIVPPNRRWNQAGQPWDQIPVAQRPMVQPAKAVFTREQWVHVAFTFDQINAGKEASGKLYLNGRYEGEISGWDLTFDWDPGQIVIALAWSYAGSIDDLAFFDRALSAEQIARVSALDGGIGQLYRSGDDSASPLR